MWGYQIVLGILGLLFGIGVAAGVFALVASLGMVPRIAGKTSVAAYVPALIFGGIFGCILAIFPQLPFQVGLWFLVVYGLASGVFLGCLSVALAEVLNVFPVLFRRVNLKNGLGFLITAFAVGKTVGGLVYFLWIA